jgi:P4 family phage/plasmid primase-like protien
MNIQILALREFFSQREHKKMKSEVWWDRGIRATSVEDIFIRPLEILGSQVAQEERFNIYYTVAECQPEQGRHLLRQNHIPFDVDDLELPNTPEVDLEALKIIARVVCGAIGVEYDKTGVLFSGGGLQLLVGTTAAIVDTGYFDIARKHYRAICDRINLRLMQNNIKGRADTSVWSPARLMRYPDTINSKPGRPERIARILQGTIERTNFTLEAASGLPAIALQDQIATKIMSYFPPPDNKTIFAECDFLKWCQAMPQDVTEPQWYAMLSIVARMENGVQLAHHLSKGHSGYSLEETDLKIQQALETSGPRTCKNISFLAGRCALCRHYPDKIKSPILIYGPDHIKTKDSGFHNVYSKEGVVKIGKPNYSDLVKYFKQKHPYISIEGTHTVWEWKDSFYTEIPYSSIKRFAEEHFDPEATCSMRKEFLEKIQVTEPMPADFFVQSTAGKMNFQNGVLDVYTRELVAPQMHHGFRSQLPCEYDPGAQCPRFMQFIDEVTLKRKELANILQEFLGYAFVAGDCYHQKILILSGVGANGKSTLVDLVRALSGKEAYSSLSVKDMQDPQRRYLLEGKMINIAEENSRDAFKDPEIIKNIASGGEILVKKLYVQPYHFRNNTKVIMLCNALPITPDVTLGMFRRFLIVPFEATFLSELGNVDKRILQKLMQELPGIFNWILAGYKRLQEQGEFSASTVVEDAMRVYQQESNSVLQWMLDDVEYEEDPGYFINRTDLYADYVSYCEQNRLNISNANTMLKELRRWIQKHGGVLEERQIRKGNQRARCINHVKHAVLPRF